MLRYPDCMRADGDCAACSLSSYGKDCHGGPASKLVWLRKRADLTQTALADRIGVAQSWVTKLERGEVNPENITLKKAIALADALAVDVRELL